MKAWQKSILFITPIAILLAIHGCNTMVSTPTQVPPTSTTVQPISSATPTLEPIDTPTITSVPTMDPGFVQSAGEKCAYTFTAPVEVGQAYKPVLTLLERGYGWNIGQVKTPFAEAQLAPEVKTLVCIQETTNGMGSYTDGAAALQYQWEIRLLDLESNTVIAQNIMMGGMPPKGKVGPGPGYGSLPNEADYAAWVLKLLGIPLLTHSAGVTSLAFSPDGNYLAVGTSFVESKLWDLKSGQATILSPYESHLMYDAAVTFSPDGNWLGYTPIDGPAFKNFGGSQAYPDLTKADVEITYLLTFSPDNQTIAIGGSVFNDAGIANTKVYVINHQNGEVKAEFSRALHIDDITFSPDGSMLAAHGQGDLSVWSLQDGQEVFNFSTGVDSGDILYYNIGKGVSFSPDGKFLAAGSNQGVVYLWNTSDWSTAFQLEGHEKQSVSVAFSSDGRLLASGGMDNAILLWDVGTGILVDTLLGHTGAVSALAFSPDDAILASGSADSTVYLRDLSAYR